MSEISMLIELGVLTQEAVDEHYKHKIAELDEKAERLRNKRKPRPTNFSKPQMNIGEYIGT